MKFFVAVLGAIAFLPAIALPASAQTCADFATQAEATAHMNRTGATRLDRDRDGIACEALPVGSAAPAAAPMSAPAARPAPVAPVESAYDRFMRTGYSLSRNRDYQSALINFRRALAERPGDRYATQAAANMQRIIEANR